MTDSEQTLEILNELLRAEAASLVPRLAESMPFVSWPAADEYVTIQRLIAEEQEHRRMLSACILAQGGAPIPIVADLRSADVHYLDLHFLLPRIIADKERLVRLYEAAADRIDPSSEPGQQVRQLLAAKREHLASLQRLGPSVVTPAGA